MGDLHGDAALSAPGASARAPTPLPTSTGASPGLLAAFVALVVAIVYIIMAPRTVLGGDNGELATLYARGGVAHPPGYPLYVVWLRVFSWLPAMTPAQGAAWATALLGAAAAGLFVRAAVAWGVRRSFAVTAALLFAFTEVSRDILGQAEVFALPVALVAAVLWVAAPEGPCRGVGRALAAGVVWGLAGAAHPVTVTLAPVAFGAVLRARGEAPSRSRAVLVAFVVALISSVGGPYALLPVLARMFPEGWVWGSFGTPRDVLEHVLRVEYGTFQLSPGSRTAAPFAHVVAAAVAAMVGSLGLVLLAPALALAARLRPARERGAGARRDRALLLAAFVLAGPVLLTFFNIPEEGIGTVLVRKFHPVPALLVTLVVALLAEDAWAPWTSRAPPTSVRRLEAAFAVALPVIQLLRTQGATERARTPVLETYLRDTLATAPKGAVLLGGGDARVLGFLYVQEALGLRPDVTVVAPALLLRPWYRERLRRRGLGVPEPRGGAFDGPGFVRGLQAGGRPVLLFDVTGPCEVLVDAFPNAPVGTLVELYTNGVDEPPVDAQLRRNEVVFAAYGAPPREVPGPWEALALEGYARPWAYLAERLRDAGRPAEAARAAARAAAWSPPALAP